MSNVTVLFDWHWRDAAGDARRMPLVARLAPARGAKTIFERYDIGAQHRLLEALQGRIAVPPTLGLETDPAALGAPFYLMRRVAGRVPPDMPPLHMAGWGSRRRDAGRAPSGSGGWAPRRCARCIGWTGGRRRRAFRRRSAPQTRWMRACACWSATSAGRRRAWRTRTTNGRSTGSASAARSADRSACAGATRAWPTCSTPRACARSRRSSTGRWPGSGTRHRIWRGGCSWTRRCRPGSACPGLRAFRPPPRACPSGARRTPPAASEPPDDETLHYYRVMAAFYFGLIITRSMICSGSADPVADNFVTPLLRGALADAAR